MRPEAASTFSVAGLMHSSNAQFVLRDMSMLGVVAAFAFRALERPVEVRKELHQSGVLRDGSAPPDSVSDTHLTLPTKA